jgi:hypothetical protein
MAKKNKVVKPDEYFSSGAFQMARFGKNIVCQNNFTDEEFINVQQNSIEEFPNVIKNIDEIVSKIAEIISRLPPQKILYRAVGEMSARFIGMTSESDIDGEDLVSQRMIDYLQSVIAGVKPHDTIKEDITEEDWQILRSLVSELFTLINLDYQNCRTAVEMKGNADFDLEFEMFYYKSQIHWCNVRGHRYPPHEAEYFKELIVPHSDVLNKLFGINGEQLVKEILKIQHSLTKGLIGAASDLNKLHLLVSDALKLKVGEKENINKIDMQKLSKEIIKENRWEEWKEDIFGRFFGLDLFDLEKVTQIPVLLLDELSWSQGEDIDFFAEGEFKGWPLRIWPIFKRPFIKLNGRYYCFDLYSFLDNFYRVLQKKVVSLDKNYRIEWNQKQQEISEMLPFKYFKRLLPNAKIYQSIYYKWYTVDGNKNKDWCEVDGLLIYDDHLFIIEVKAGAFTYTSPANDFPAYIKSIKDLVLKPAIQGKRFLEYIQSRESVDIFNKNHDKICQLSNKDFRQITICPITLDSFTELAAQVQHLKALGVDVGNFPVWSISIDDLRVYSDIFENPLIFLHFVEQRMKAFASDVIQVEDELDHLGLYIEHNIYTLHAKNLKGNSEAQLISFAGYCSNIDKYFHEKMQETHRSSLIKQSMPAHFAEIIDVLSKCSKLGRAKVASYLLDCNSSYRNDISDSIEKTLAKQIVLRRSLPFSIYIGINLTVFCWQQPFLPRMKELAMDHSRAAMLVAGNNERLLLELVYKNDGTLESIDWNDIRLVDICDSERPRLMGIADSIKNSRLQKAGKISRNDLCPCGSGKKYKKCCIQVKL